jgi:hypothetical protein
VGTPSPDPFAVADVDSSGSVTYEEYIQHARRRGVAGEESARTFFRLDANQNGSLNRGEWSQRSPETSDAGEESTETKSTEPADATGPAAEAQPADASATEAEVTTSTAADAELAESRTPTPEASRSGPLGHSRVEPTGALTIKEARRAGLVRQKGIRLGLPTLSVTRGQIRSGTSPLVGMSLLFDSLYLLDSGASDLHPAFGGAAGFSMFVADYESDVIDPFSGKRKRATLFTLGPELVARGGVAYHLGRGVMIDGLLDASLFYTFPVVAENMENAPLAALAVGPTIGFEFDRIAKNTTLLRGGARFSAGGLHFLHFSIGLYFN